MDKKNIILIVSICFILIFGVAAGLIYAKDDKNINTDTFNDSSINKEPIIDNSNDVGDIIIPEKVSLVASYDEIKKMENTNYPINDIEEGLYIVKEKNKCGVIDINNNVIEEIKYDNIVYLVDDYYYTEEGKVKTLKRKGNVVSDISKYEKGKLYKDNNDINSLYIMLNEYIYNDYLTISEDANVINLGGTLRGVYYKDSYNIAGINGNTSSIVYDASTGNIITELKGAINKSNNSFNSNYIVTYRLATYMRAYTYYDNDFNMITDDNYYFHSGQCDGNTYSSAVTDGSKKYGYFSLDKKKLIVPIEYENIYSVNSNDTLFVVKNNDKYGLIDNNNKTVFPFEYDYIIIINDYIITIKDNTLNVYDRNINKLDKYSFDIDTNNKLASYGLCDPEYDYINVSRYVDDNIAKLNFYNDGKIKTLLFYGDKIELYEDEVNIIFGYSLDMDERYFVFSSIRDNSIKKVEIYNINKNKLYDIDLSKYDISLSNNELPLDGVSSIYNISYDFDCKYFVISYNDKNNNRNNIYFDLDKKEIIDNPSYLYCRTIDDNYFYYPIYDKNNSRDKYELYNNSEKILDFINDIEKIEDDYFLVDRTKIYKLNK